MDERLLQRLRSNDETLTRLSLRRGLLDDPFVSPIGDALQENTVVDELSIRISIIEDYDSILHWIGASPSLRKITVVQMANIDEDGLDGGRVVMLAILRRFLLAIANNSGVQQVFLRFDMRNGALDTDAFVALLRSKRPRLDLTLGCLGFHSAGDEQLSIVQDALRANTSLCSLGILHSTIQVFNTLLPALSACPTVKEIVLSPPSTYHNVLIRPRVALERIADFLLACPASLEHVHLKAFQRRDGGFVSVLQSLANNKEGPTKVTFERCSFSLASGRSFKRIFQNNQRIQTLVIEQSILFTSHGRAGDTETTLGDCLRSNTGLKELDIGDLSFAHPHLLAQFLSVMNALVVNSTLERLKCGRLYDRCCSVLAKSLPKVSGLKELSIYFEGRYRFSKQDLLQAFKQNCSLVRVVIDQDQNTPYFTAADIRKVSFYTQRNKHLPAMLSASTEDVPVSLWPMLFVVAQESSSGPTEIFRALLHLGDKVGTPQFRKRERPGDFGTMRFKSNCSSGL